MKKSKTLKSEYRMLAELEARNIGYIPQPEWDEVVETEINKYDEIGKIFHEFDMHMSIPVRIKCRKGAILIERLKGVGK